MFDTVRVTPCTHVGHTPRAVRKAAGLAAVIRRVVHDEDSARAQQRDQRVFEPVQKTRRVHAVRPFIVIVGRLPITLQCEQGKLPVNGSYS